MATLLGRVDRLSRSRPATSAARASTCQLGGLVGFNFTQRIDYFVLCDRERNGDRDHRIDNGNVDCSIAGSNCQWDSVGGLVGSNSGTIQGNAVVPLLTQPCVFGQTCASGAVSVGSGGQGGGLVGSNDGIIANAFATGTVTGAAGLSNFGNATSLGGLAGDNSGLITDSHATGNVGTLNVAESQVGGLVSDNSGTIVNSYAIGNVRAGDNSSAGGLTSEQLGQQLVQRLLDRRWLRLLQHRPHQQFLCDRQCHRRRSEFRGRVVEF